jgi:hypothetical protein
VYIRISAKKVPRFTAKRLILELHSRNGTDLLAIRFYSAISGKSSRSALALNLLNNAWKFTGHRAAGRIEFGSMRQDSGITAYFIKDNGAGFDMNYASKLFGPFSVFTPKKNFREPESDWRRSSGSFIAMEVRFGQRVFQEKERPSSLL